MKKILFILSVFMLMPAFMSCMKVSGKKIVFETNNIHFSQEGGSKVVRLISGNFGDMWIDPISGTNETSFEGDGKNYLKRDWIEMTKTVSDETISLIITTSPNTSGAARYAQFIFNSADRYAYIKVYQE